MEGRSTRREPADIVTAEHARAQLDAIADAAASTEVARRRLIIAVADSHATSAWTAAGARSCRDWLRAYAGLGAVDAAHTARVGRLCHRFPELRAAVEVGEIPLARIEQLVRTTTTDREDHLAASLPTLLDLAAQAVDDVFGPALRFWAEQVDQLVAPRPHHRHRVHLSQQLFGGGTVLADLSPASFATVAAALDAHLQDPDPADAPHRRTLAERRADALDDMAHHSLTCRHQAEDGPADDDTADLWVDDDELDQLLDAGIDPDDQLGALRQRIRTTERARRRREHRSTRAKRSATVSVHIDLRTLAGRALDDLAGVDLRTDGWALARNAAERLLCDADVAAVLFAGRQELIGSTVASPLFTPAQRRTLAARDRGCAFPSCTQPPSRCDAHHLRWRSDGGATAVDNGVLICRHHHRLVHEAGWLIHRDDCGWVATDPHGHEWATSPPHPQRE